MVNSINIKNFLTFDSLEISSLKRINLIGGKNNAGKTSFLEALLILISEGENRVINTVLKDRGVLDKGSLTTYKDLYYKNKEKQNGIADLKINNFKIQKDEDNKRYMRDYGGSKTNLSPSMEASLGYEHFSYVPAHSSLDDIEKVWNTIALTKDEEIVIEILKKVIDKRITKLQVGSLATRTQINGEPVDIKTLGDGVSRILYIAINLVAAKNKYLLIDEIETALHYTAQEKLWEVIFEYAEKWKIQVFATTHSRDTIRSFKYACTKFEKNGEVDAQYLRLQKSRDGKFEAIAFDNSRLDQSLDLNIEIR